MGIREKRLAEGMCYRCGGMPPVKGKQSCIFCSIAGRERMAENNKKRKETGLCIRCLKRPPEGSTVHCEECKAASKEPAQRYKSAEKKQFMKMIFAHYGDKCACCNEIERKFLTIDHVNSDGAEHRKEVGTAEIARWLVRNDFPEGFQILCYNCNLGRARNGGVCPHKA